MTDERKPLAPDRPGRYLLRNGKEVSVMEQDLDQWHGPKYIWFLNGCHVLYEYYDIIAIAPGDAAWCLAQARLLCPEGLR